MITAVEAGLLGSAETPFAILLARLLFSKLPPLYRFIGGSIVLAAVFIYAIHEVVKVDTRSV